MKKEYIRDVDAKVSAFKLINLESSLTLIRRNSSQFYVGFIPDVAVQCTNKFDIHKVVIHSTGKTNAEKLELFAVIGNCVGFGVPLAYVLLESSKMTPANSAETFRKHSIRQFLEALREALPQLRPQYFSSDKDWGQLEGIKTIFNMNPLLCLWHMKRAIMKRSGEIKKKNKSITNDQEQVVFTLVT